MRLTTCSSVGSAAHDDELEIQVCVASAREPCWIGFFAHQSREPNLVAQRRQPHLRLLYSFQHRGHGTFRIARAASPDSALAHFAGKGSMLIPPTLTVSVCGAKSTRLPGRSPGHRATAGRPGGPRARPPRRCRRGTHQKLQSALRRYQPSPRIAMRIDARVWTRSWRSSTTVRGADMRRQVSRMSRGAPALFPSLPQASGPTG